ncbi:MAG: rhodanese-like domain-containing protein [Clostridiaceae bacterium]
MKKFKVLVLLMALVMAVSLIGCGAKDSSSSVPKSVTDAVNSYYANMPEDIYKIDQVKFVDAVKANDGAFILDIRQKDVYDQGHVKGAINAPWGAGLADVLDKLPADKTIYVYCYTGQTAGQTVALLNMAGFKAKSVNLGWNLGISKVAGVEAITETTTNAFPQVTAAKIDADVKAAIQKYFQGLGTISDAKFKDYKVSETDAKALLDAGDKNVVFLSVRKAEDFTKGHIKGAVNIPFGKGMEQKFSSLPKDKKIIVYCYTGQTAGQVVAGLRLLGYDAVSLNGGIGTPANAPNGWGNKGFPLVTE